jgi:putative Holliday junction resolvase
MTGTERVLGIDHGQARIGLALSDSLRISAQPFEVIARKTDLLAAEQIAGIVRDNGVDRVVVGLPRNMDGSLGPQAERIKEFAELLETEMPDVSVLLWDERLTTAQSERLLIEAGTSRRKRKQKIDKMAAAIMLQSYLDYLANTPPATQE